MTKAKLILIIAFVVTLAAGVVAGFTLRSLTHHSRRSFVEGLTAAQKAKMDEIWNAVRRNSREVQNEQRKEFQKQREEAVRALLTAEQRVKYDEILKDHAGKMAELGNAREKAFQEAVEKTKLILNAEQRNKYEEWLKNWHEDRHPGGAPAELKGPPRSAAAGQS